ncbi:hypothetical protein D3C81_2282690 [compost metagenome]
MITRFDHGVVVGDDHFFVANDRADGGAWRQADVLDGFTDDFARLLIAVGNGLDGLRRAAPQ